MVNNDSVRIETHPCENCLRDTDHAVLQEKDIGGESNEGLIWWSDNFKLIECQGCHAVSLCRAHTFSESIIDPDNPEPEWVKYFPPRLMRRIPDWVMYIPQEMQDLLEEVYDAVRSKHYRLAAMGVRAIIDAVARHNVGDTGSFVEHLDALQDGGVVGQKQKETLAIVVDAGSAAGHRGFLPPEGLIFPMLDAIEAVLNGLYYSGPMLAQARAQIPPRPPPVKKTKG